MKELTENQTAFLRTLINDMSVPVDRAGVAGMEIVFNEETVDLPAEERTQVIALAGLVFLKAFRQDTRENRGTVRRLSAHLVNGASGARQERENEEGFEHHELGYSGLTRNHSNRIKTRR